MGNAQKYVLGLDMGSASLGWGLIGLDEHDVPTTLIDAGVRIFEPGVDGSSFEIEIGKDKSKSVDRRVARLQRRQLRRRVGRQRNLFVELQRAGLLPTEPLGATSEHRHALLNELDNALTRRYLPTEGDTFARGPLYFLRKRALYHALEAHELGRVLFHLSQRRGFKSNRKETSKVKDDENTGKVKEGIRSLEEAMRTANADTVGEYFAGVDPHEARIRGRWTARHMFEQEFAAIWERQQAHHPDILTQKLRERIAHLLFFQRPLMSQKNLIGPCELESGERRAPWYSLPAQRFRILQKINDAKWLNPTAKHDDPLTLEQKQTLFRFLEDKGDQSFVAIKKALGRSDRTLNLEKSKHKEMMGNRTAKSMQKVFGERWKSFSEAEQNGIVRIWGDTESDEALTEIAKERWGLDENGIRLLLAESPAKDYCSLSLKAITKLMPLMQSGTPFKEAEKAVYFSTPVRRQEKDKLPPVRQAIPTLRNPAVERSMTELRKVVNAIVRKYEKPYEIRIELARDLKKPRDEREKIGKANLKRKKDNEVLAKQLAEECGLTNPSGRDLLKARLWAEQKGQCPYTGKTVALSQLFHNPEFDVDHIIPISRYPDDSYQNKVLCSVEANRNRKRNRTPFEAFSADAEEWNDILNRVSQWKNPGKLRKFRIESAEELDEFTTRQMNDTRYSSVLASRLLAQLYGGDCAEDGRRIIHATSGAVTATLRRNWKFELFLQALAPLEKGETRGKPRTDHRHHAVDAITIALTRQSVIQSMARQNQFVPPQPNGDRAWKDVPKPWTDPEFERLMGDKLAGMVVSHRPEHKVSGELHKGSNYGRPFLYEGKSTIHSRCAVHALSAADIEADDVIVDPAVRDAVRAKLEEIGGNPKSFEKSGNLPYLISPSGKNTPIKKVRIRETKNPLRVGSGMRERFVASGGIHHVELFACRDEARREIWDSNVVQRTEAYERQRKKQPVISRTLEGTSECTFLFSLSNDDTIEIDTPEGRRIMRIKKSGENKQIFYVPVNDAHTDADQSKHGIVKSKYPSTLKSLNPRKVVVDLLGKVHPAND